MTQAVQLLGIRKVFPHCVAIDGVDFDLRRGEIHALLGENGAGKSSLMNVLAGLYQPDAGEIHVGGHRVVLRSPRDSRARGVGMVHQHVVLSERHTALQNIILGRKGLGLVPRLSRLRAEVAEAARRYGLDLDLDTPLHAMSVGERQKVEIVRALFHGASILVLDEPTGVLSARETEVLFEVLGRFRDDGGSVVHITHKLDEVFQVADRVTVLRRGRNVGTRDISEVDPGILSTLMVGHALDLRRRQGPIPVGAPETIRLDDVSVEGPSGRPLLDGVSFAAGAGEIFGVAGVTGSGQHELVEVLGGLRRPDRGVLTLMGCRVTRPSPASFRDAGVAWIPADRTRTGCVGSMTVAENLVLREYRRRFAHRGILRWKRVGAWARERIEELKIQCPSPDAPVAHLSGGNIQKVVLARELFGQPRLVVAAWPCRGLDVGAAEDVRGHLLAAARRLPGGEPRAGSPPTPFRIHSSGTSEARAGLGATVILVSEDLDELLRLSDRIGVMFRGRMSTILDVADATPTRLGLLLGGEDLP